MKVKDITYLHPFIVKVARGFGSDYPEDVAQNVWIKLLEMEEKEGNIDRIVYEDGTINTFYIFKMTRTATVDEMRMEKRHAEIRDSLILNEDYDPRLKEVYEAFKILDAQDLVNDIGFFRDWAETDATERGLAKKYGVSRHKIRTKLLLTKKKILDIVNQG